jgi:hypothetical protein
MVSNNGNYNLTTNYNEIKDMEATQKTFEAGNQFSFNSNEGFKIDKLVIDGKSYQATGADPISPSSNHPSEVKSVKGKNLWKNSDYLTNLLTGEYVIENGGFTFTRGDITGGKYIAKKFKVEKDKTYTFSALSNDFGTNNFYICIYRTKVYGTLVKSTIANFLTYTATATEELFFTFIIGTAITSVTVNDIQVDINNTKTDYVPYGNIQIKNLGKNLLKKGGLATPLSDADFWHSSTNKNGSFTPLEDGWCKINVDNTAGANIVYINQYVNRGNISNLKENTDYTFLLETRNIEYTNNVDSLVIAGNENTTAWQQFKRISVSNLQPKQTFTLKTKTTFSSSNILDLRNFVMVSVGGKVSFEYRLMIVEQSSQVTLYEPYQENITNIDLKGNELCSLPNNVKDELVVENGRAKIIKNVGKIILNGSER